MAEFTYLEKQRLEKLFGMGSGYVLRFSDKTFREFVHDTTSRNIDDEKYKKAGTSKANRLRTFWSKEPRFECDLPRDRRAKYSSA